MAEHWGEPELIDAMGHRIFDDDRPFDDHARETTFFLLYRMMETGTIL